MRRLLVVYDMAEIATHTRYWLEREPQYVPIDFVPARHFADGAGLPGLDPASVAERITAIDDEGNLWRDGKAELVVMWALRRYRSRALLIGHPSRLPFRRSNLNWMAGGAGVPWPERRASA